MVISKSASKLSTFMLFLKETIIHFCHCEYRKKTNSTYICMMCVTMYIMCAWRESAYVDICV